MVQPVGPLHCSTNQKLQQSLSKERRRSHQLHQQLRDQITISEELVQQYFQREDELNRKYQESVEVSERKIQQLEEKLSTQEQTTQDLFHGLTEERLKNVELLEQLERKVRFKDLQDLEKRVKVVQQELIAKESFLQDSRDCEVRLDQRVREMCQQLCEKEHSQTQLQDNVTSLKQAVNQLHLQLKDQQDQCQQNEARLKDQYEQNEARLKDQYEQNEARLKAKYEQNEARLRDQCEQIDARLKEKEKYIHLLKRDMTERENLFRSQFLLHNNKVEKQIVECRELRAQLQQEQQLTLNLKGELHALREAERSRQHKAPPPPPAAAPSTAAPPAAAPWRRLLGSLSTNFHTHWVDRGERSQET
uniref:Uncharacterized protein n=1 Tax=Knipowitschia caucasica TaxID=637954 RepID=A0AAV2JDE5_KNICA